MNHLGPIELDDTDFISPDIYRGRGGFLYAKSLFDGGELGPNTHHGYSDDTLLTRAIEEDECAFAKNIITHKNFVINEHIVPAMINLVRAADRDPAWAQVVEKLLIKTVKTPKNTRKETAKALLKAVFWARCFLRRLRTTVYGLLNFCMK